MSEVPAVPTEAFSENARVMIDLATLIREQTAAMKRMEGTLCIEIHQAVRHSVMQFKFTESSHDMVQICREMKAGQIEAASE